MFHKASRLKFFILCYHVLWFFESAKVRFLSDIVKSNREPYPVGLGVVDAFVVAMLGKQFDGGFLGAVKDGVDGVVAGNVLYLPTAEVVTLGQHSSVAGV